MPQSPLTPVSPNGIHTTHTITPITKQTGIKFDLAKTQRQVSQLSDHSLEMLYRVVKKELRSRDEDFKLAVYKQEQERIAKQEAGRKGKVTPHG